VRHSLEITYIIRRLMNGKAIAEYATLLHSAAEFLQDTAAAYVGKAHTSALGGIASSIDALHHLMSNDEQNATANHALAAGKAIVALGKQHHASHAKNVEQLLMGKLDPLSALDVLRMMGGYFSRGKQYVLKVEHVDNPFAKRSGQDVKDDTSAVAAVVTHAAGAFPSDKPVKLTAKEVRDELDSMWGELSTDQQRELVRGLAIDCQRVAELVEQIAAQGDAKAFEEGSGLAQKLDTGKQRPKSALELYRMMYGVLKKQP